MIKSFQTRYDSCEFIVSKSPLMLRTRLQQTLAGAPPPPPPDPAQSSTDHECASTTSTEPAKATCLAEQLWYPWRSIAMNPINTFLVYVIGNSVFCASWLVLRWIIHLLTAPGFVFLLVASIFVFARYVAIALSYPGHLQLVVRDGEQNFARITKRRVEMFMEAATELLGLLATPNGSQSQSRSRRQFSTSRKILFMQAFENYTFASDTMLKPLLESLQWLAQDQRMDRNTKPACLMALLEEIWDFHCCHLVPICRDLVACGVCEFEDRKRQLVQDHQQQVLGTTSAAPTTTSSSTITITTNTVTTTNGLTTGGGGKSGPLLHEFMLKLDQLAQTVPHLGAPKVQIKRELTWLFKEYLQPKRKSEGIANLDLMRADLAARFHGEQVWIRGYRDERIDGMFLPAITPPPPPTTTTTPTATTAKPSCNRTVLLCNPNGALYEFHHFQTDWIRFYVELGCNVFVYNYRGYGRNKGSPAPLAHNYDGLAIVEYLKHERQSDKIAVHGESIGGLVATFVAKNSKDVDVLIADRTFATLPALAERLIASWAGKAMSYVTNWETDNVTNYLEASCHKILCSDPNDEIILEGGSLKTGVALRLLLNEQTFHIPQSPIASSSSSKSPTSKCQLCPTWTKHMAHVAQVKRKHKVQSDEEMMDTDTDDDQTLLTQDGGTSSPTAAGIPSVGKPLTEQMVLQFSEALGSLAQRAARLIRIFNGEHDEDDEEDSSNDEDSHDHDDDDDAEQKTSKENHNDETRIRMSSAVSDQLLVDTWIILARWDGLCGQMLYEAVEHGYDHIRAWLASLLIWGPRVPHVLRHRPTSKPLERQGFLLTPLTTGQVLEALQKLQHTSGHRSSNVVVSTASDNNNNNNNNSSRSSSSSLASDLDVLCCLQMVEYVRDTLVGLWKREDEQAGTTTTGTTTTASGTTDQAHAPSSTGVDRMHRVDTTIGRLLALHCGHNHNFTDEEKQKLIQLLRDVNFL